MDEYRTQAYEPEPDPDYDWDYEETGPPPPKILWGRVVAFGAAVVIALLIGLWAAPNGIPQEQLAAAEKERDALKAQVSELQAERVTLRTQIRDANERIDNLERQVDEGTNEGTVDPQPTDIETYEIKPGDSLSKIAQQVYGDAELSSCLADFNDIENENQLEIGADIFIPAEEDVCGDS